MPEIITKKCPDCGGEIVKSRYYYSTGHLQYEYFWAKPWATKLVEVVNFKVFPWACMKCGRVFFYLEEKDSEQLKAEYDKQKVESKI